LTLSTADRDAYNPGLLVALGLAALFALAAEVQSDGGKTLRLAPYADLTVVDPQFIGV